MRRRVTVLMLVAATTAALAAVLLSRDPTLTSARGDAVRQLLRLFERKTAMRTLAAG